MLVRMCGVCVWGGGEAGVIGESACVSHTFSLIILKHFSFVILLGFFLFVCLFCPFIFFLLFFFGRFFVLFAPPTPPLRIPRNLHLPTRNPKTNTHAGVPGFAQLGLFVVGCLTSLPHITVFLAFPSAARRGRYNLLSHPLTVTEPTSPSTDPITLFVW